MALSACPRCGFARAPNGKCLRCGVFSPPPGAGKGAGSGVTARRGFAAARAGAPSAGTGAPLRTRIYKILRWGAFAFACILLFLILRPGDPPQVYRDPEAPQRLEKKLRRAGDAPAAGGGGGG